MSAEPKGLAVVPPRFNPSEHLTPARKNGPADYLQVKWRLVWLREEHPDAQVESELREGGIESNYAVFKARVSIPGGGSATGWGSETKADFGDFLEKAETKAVGRALGALGFGTQFAPDLDEGERIVDSPVARPRGGGRRGEAPPATATEGGDSFGPDLDWTTFWSWARKRGYRSKHDVAEALGKDDAAVNDWTPAQMRTALEVAQQAAG